MSRDVERHEEFDRMLDECYEPYKLGSLTFYASDVLYKCDPIAYHIESNDYDSIELEEEEE
jgi:hypothetical protein